MEKIIINRDKCTLCGKCTEECPNEVLSRNSSQVSIDKPEYCISCGHCAAVCPEDAITSKKIDRRHFTIHEVDGSHSSVTARLLLKRSIRNFTQKDIGKNTIEELIRAAEKAPRASNHFVRKYFAVTDTGVIDELEDRIISAFNKLRRMLLNPVSIAILSVFSSHGKKELLHLKSSLDRIHNNRRQGKAPIFRNAPLLIFIAAPAKDRTGKDDCIAAQHYMMLYGETIGLGSCIIGYAQHHHKLLEKRLNIPKSLTIHAVSIFGYSKNKYEKEIRFKDPDISWIS